MKLDKAKAHMIWSPFILTFTMIVLIDISRDIVHYIMFEIILIYLLGVILFEVLEK